MHMHVALLERFARGKVNIASNLKAADKAVGIGPVSGDLSLSHCLDQPCAGYCPDVEGAQSWLMTFYTADMLCRKTLSPLWASNIMPQRWQRQGLKRQMTAA